MASIAEELFKEGFNNYDDDKTGSQQSSVATADDNDDTNHRDQSKTNARQSTILLRNDVLVPNVVRFTATHNNIPSRRRKLCRRATAVSIILALAVFGFIHVSKIVWEFSQEAMLDIESKNITSVVVARTTSKTTP